MWPPLVTSRDLRHAPPLKVRRHSSLGEDTAEGEMIETVGAVAMDSLLVMVLKVKEPAEAVAIVREVGAKRIVKQSN